MCSLLPKSGGLGSATCRYSCQTIRSNDLRRINNLAKRQELANVLTIKKGTQFAIRSLTFEDIPAVMNIRRQMGAIEVESCLRSWITLDPGCIKVAVINTGEIIGTMSTAKNGDGEDGICFAGMFYVQPEHQNQGIGVKMWNSCLQHVGFRNSGLNAVPGKLDVYRTAGYPVYDDSFTTVEYRITSSDVISSLSNTPPPPGVSISPFYASHLPSIFAFDLAQIGFQRTTALASNLLEVGSRTLVALRRNGDCAGFGTVKITCTGAARVGPLYADGPEIAEVLFRRLVGGAAGFVFVATSGNLHVRRWMDRSGVKAFKKCDRLYVKEKLCVDHEKIFALFDVNFAPF